MKQGFTLVELILVTAILAILATTVILTLDAPRNLAASRDARRQTDVENLLNAVHLATLDSAGKLPGGMTIPMPETQIGSALSGCQIVKNGCKAEVEKCLDLRDSLSHYLKTVPFDPALNARSTTTAYTLSVDDHRIITIKACNTEGNTYILTSR